MKLESVSGLSQHALIIDVAAKIILADNIASLMCTAAAAAVPQVARRCNRAYAAQVCARMLAPVLLWIGDAAALVGDAIALMARWPACCSASSPDDVVRDPRITSSLIQVRRTRDEV